VDGCELLDSRDELAPHLLRDQILGRATSSMVAISLSFAVDGRCTGDEFLADGEEAEVGAPEEGRRQLSLDTPRHERELGERVETAGENEWRRR
jgi:hypothetical protein